MTPRGGKYNFGRILPTNMGPSTGSNVLTGLAEGVPSFMKSFYQARSFADQQRQQEERNKQVQERLRLMGSAQDIQRTGQGLTYRGQDVTLRGQDLSAAQAAANERYRQEQAGQTELKTLMSSLHPSVYRMVQGGSAAERANFIRQNYDRLSAASQEARASEEQGKVRLAARTAGASATARGRAEFEKKRRIAQAEDAGMRQWMVEQDPNFTGPPAPPGPDVIPYRPSASVNPAAQAAATTARLQAKEPFQRAAEARRTMRAIEKAWQASYGAANASELGAYMQAMSQAEGRSVSLKDALISLRDGRILDPQTATSLVEEMARQGDAEAQELLQRMQE